MKARIHVRLKPGVLDPQGAAIEQSLHGLGFGDVRDVRQGKLFEFELAATEPDAARAEAAKMCEALLANTVIETYEIELV